MAMHYSWVAKACTQRTMEQARANPGHSDCKKNGNPDPWLSIRGEMVVLTLTCNIGHTNSFSPLCHLSKSSVFLCYALGCGVLPLTIHLTQFSVLTLLRMALCQRASYQQTKKQKDIQQELRTHLEVVDSLWSYAVASIHWKYILCMDSVASIV